MDEAAWVDLTVDALDAWYRRVVEANPRARSIDGDGFFALVTPEVPERSLFNAVVCADGEGLRAAREDLAEVYAADGCAWTVWLPERDRETAAALEAAGHVLDATPAAMGIELDGFAEPDLSQIDWTGEMAFGDLCLVNDRAYGMADGTFSTGFGRVAPEGSQIYGANVDGEAASVLIAFDHDGPAGPDCSVWLVATLEPARGKGLSTALMQRALWDAAQRGCATSSLQATKLGAPVYRKIGYADFGPINMWEFRE